MAAELDLIIDMVSVMGAAALGGYVASACKQPVLLGYLLGGIVIGPAGLGWVGSNDIQVLAEIGVVLLLFALGVEFSLKDLLRVRAIALGGGSLQILLTLLLGGSLAYATGWVSTLPQAVFLGAVLSLSSTAVVLKSLVERNEVQTAYGQIMLAILIVQDLALGVMLAVLPALTQTGSDVVGALLAALLKVLIFLGVAVAVGKWLIPSLIQQVVRQGSQELFLLVVVSLCLGIAMLTSYIGLGIEMGAFVAGLMISNVEYADHALDRVLPMRDVFATLFFASIGLLIDPGFLWQNFWILLGLVAIVMAGKGLIVTAIVRGFGYPLKTALTVGAGINQIGEFSFVLASVAQLNGVFSERLYGLTLGTTAATLLLTPLSFKLVPWLLQWIDQQVERSPWLEKLLAGEMPQLVGLDESKLQDHIIVAGFGRVGQTLVRMLYFQGHQILVIDNNEAQLQTLRQRQIPYLYGDACSPLLLEKANLHRARAMAITLPDPMATRLLLNRALGLAPHLDITVRVHGDEEIETVYQLGAQEVVQPEFEAALEMGAHLLLNLGDDAATVQRVVNRYRTGRYRDILPTRSQYWGADSWERSLEGLAHQWVTIEDHHRAIGQTLAELNIRRNTGATVMAIERGRSLHRYPKGEMRLAAGDRLLVVGNSEEQAALQQCLQVGRD